MSKINQQSLSRGYVLLQPGPYDLSISGVRERAGSEGPYAEVQFIEPQTGKVLYQNFSLVSGGWAIEEMLVSAQIPLDLATELDFESEETQQLLVGNMVRAQVYTDEWPAGSKRFRNKVGAFLPPQDYAEAEGARTVQRLNQLAVQVS